MHTAILDIDHNAYLVDPEKKDEFSISWQNFTLVEKVSVETQDYPASHCFLGRAEADKSLVSMIVPSGEETVLHKVIERNGSGLFYSAYALSPETDIDSLYDQMNAWGWKLLGPVHTYEDSRGPQQNAIAVAPAYPYGPFTIFLQRRNAPEDELRHEVDIIMLDSIYEQYDLYCQSAE